MARSKVWKDPARVGCDWQIARGEKVKRHRINLLTILAEGKSETVTDMIDLAETETEGMEIGREEM
jgi:hypothetical protein